MIEIAIISGLWGWLFATELTKDGEILGFTHKLVRFILTGSGKIQELTGFRALIHKAVFCPKCHAGWVCIVISLFYDIWFLGLIKAVIISMSIAAFLEKTTK